MVYDLADAEKARIEEATKPMRELLEHVKYKEGWRFAVSGPALLITIDCVDSQTGRDTRLTHGFPAGTPGDISEKELRRVLFEFILSIERHEAMEFFRVDGVAPYFPDHTPGADHYALVDRTDP